MFSLSPQEVAHLTNSELLVEGTAPISHFAIDTRQCRPQDTFVAFKGDQLDANDFVCDALLQGASCVVMTRQPTSNELTAAKKKKASLIVTKEAESFLQELARFWREKNSWLVIGVTGSCGKTTTKELLVGALQTTYHTYATPGNFNSVIGVPLSILHAPDDVEVFVCEMGMSAASEIDVIASVARPHIGIITNIGTSHIGLLGSQENIARAKAEMVAWLANPLSTWKEIEPCLFMDGSNKQWTDFIQKHFCHTFKVGLTCVGTPQDSWYATDIQETRDGISFMLESPYGSCTTQLAFPGSHTSIDAVLSVAVAVYAGVDFSVAVRGLATVEPKKMRQLIMHASCGATILDDSYNASPISIAYAIKSLWKLSGDSPKKAVLGEVGELGDQAARLHTAIGAFIAAWDFDQLIFVGEENAKIMYEVACMMGFDSSKLTCVQTAKEAAQVLLRTLKADDFVLVKGSRFLALDHVVDEVK